MKDLTIENLKQKHGNLVQVDLEGKQLLFSKPTRAVVSLSITKSQRDPLMGVEVLVDNCYVGGDLDKEAILGDVAVLMSLLPAVNQIIGIKMVEVKNL